MNQSQQASSNPQKGSLKWLLIILAVVVVLGGGYLLYAKYGKKSSTATSTTSPPATTTTPTANTTTPTITDETADWQTYTSKDYGYSIKFPQNLYYKGNKVQQYPDQSGAQDLIISDVQNMGIQDILANEKIHLDILVQPNDGKTLNQFVDDSKLGGTISDKKEITLGSTQAIQFTLKNEFNEIIVYTFVLKGNNIYILRATNAVKGDTVDSQNFVSMKKIVNTFQFTK